MTSVAMATCLAFTRPSGGNVRGLRAASANATSIPVARALDIPAAPSDCLAICNWAVGAGFRGLGHDRLSEQPAIVSSDGLGARQLALTPPPGAPIIRRMPRPRGRCRRRIQEANPETLTPG